MKRVLILANINKINKEILNDSYVIGVDKGAYVASLNNIIMDVAIGDFDSIETEMMDTIKDHSKKIIKLNSIKDFTDTNEALALCDPSDEIIILGGIQGKRIEHFYANILELKRNPNLKMLDDYSLIETKNKSFKPNMDYKYISFFSLEEESIISLSGFSYNLDNYSLKENDPLCISNEINTNNPFVEIKKGRLLVIYTKEDHNKEY